MNGKLLIVTNLIFLSTALFFAYKYFKEDPINPDVRPVPACSDCGKEIGTSFGGIRATTARGISGNYKSNQLISINATGYVTNDARSVWFPLDTIKRFIYEIERTTCTKGCNDKAFGIRFYYAAYPTVPQMSLNADLNALDQSYSKHHTIFMVPTYTDAASGGPVDFDPWHMNGCNPKSYTQIMNSSDSLEKSLILMPSYYPQTFQMRVTNSGTSGGTSGTVQNHGGLCPPICQPPQGTAF
jgi:hypothetical protein